MPLVAFVAYSLALFEGWAVGDEERRCRGGLHGWYEGEEGEGGLKRDT